MDINTPEEKKIWFLFNIAKRDRQGRPLRIEINRMRSSNDGLSFREVSFYGTSEKFTIDENFKWVSDAPNSRVSQIFKEKYPLLNQTIDEILSLLSTDLIP